MTRTLCVSATYLDPQFHGRADRGDTPEWPPTPLRLFQALLAGARATSSPTEWSAASADAFRWLERRPAPVIVAPHAVEATPYVLAVPNNDSDTRPDRSTRLAPKPRFPQRMVDGDTIYYLWPIADADWASAEPHVRTLCAVARRLVALGWGIDQVIGNARLLTDPDILALPGERWRPRAIRSFADAASRIPVTGTLAELETVHSSAAARLAAGLPPAPRRLLRFVEVAYEPAGLLPAHPFAVFAIVPLSDGREIGYAQEDIARVASMLRGLTIQRALADSHEFPGGTERYVAGHAPAGAASPPRFSYLPLPGKDGYIRHTLIAEPAGGDGRHAEWARQRLSGGPLRDLDGSPRASLLPVDDASSDAAVRPYVASAAVWSTVTPIVLPGSDDHRRTKSEKLLASAISHSGIPSEIVSGITIQKAPFHRRGPATERYFRPEYLRHRGLWHVRLVFRDIVRGPLTLGAGRHVGLGLFAAEER